MKSIACLEGAVYGDSAWEGRLAGSHPSFASVPGPGEDGPEPYTAPELEIGHAKLERAAIMQLKAERAELTWSAVGTVTGEHVTLHKSPAGVVVAKSAAVDRSRVGVLASPVVRGDVHTWLDLRTAFAVGIGIYAGKLVADVLRRFWSR